MPSPALLGALLGLLAYGVGEALLLVLGGVLLLEVLGRGFAPQEDWEQGSQEEWWDHGHQGRWYE